jgi:tripartite-type tricarboxylate transporter receptor subunit TctC
MSTDPGVIRAGTLAACLLALPFMLAAPAWAPHEPSHKVRLVVPLPPGTLGDAAARTIAEKAGENLGAPIQIENRPGAGGLTGAAEVKKSETDGATLLFTPVDPLVFVRVIPGAPEVDPIRDLAPVTQVGTLDLGIAVAAEARARTLTDLLAEAKANPGKLTYAVPAPASLPNLVAVTVAKGAGVELTAVAVGGTPPAITAALSGQVTAVVAPIIALAPLHADGKIRILAKTGRERSPLLPDVPTLREQGVELDATGWYGVFAPAGTPRALVDRLNQALVGAIQAPEIRERLQRIGLQPTGTTPDELDRIRRTDLEVWARATREGRLLQ